MFETWGLSGIHKYVNIIPDMENQEEKLLKHLNILRAEHRSLIRLLLRKDELAIGTVYKVNKRCVKRRVVLRSKSAYTFTHPEGLVLRFIA